MIRLISNNTLLPLRFESIIDAARVKRKLEAKGKLAPHDMKVTLVMDEDAYNAIIGGSR